jgi:hypothetical protein
VASADIFAGVSFFSSRLHPNEENDPMSSQPSNGVQESDRSARSSDCFQADAGEDLERLRAKIAELTKELARLRQGSPAHEPPKPWMPRMSRA